VKNAASDLPQANSAYGLARQLLSGHLPDATRSSLVERARRLREAERRGASALPLRGRHIAVVDLCEEGCGAADIVTRAAEALGARVSHIDSEALRRPGDLSALARMLGSLYDAVDCGELEAGRALELQALAGVPVFTGLACHHRPLWSLAPELAGERAIADRAAAEREDLTALVKAVLLETVA